MMVALRNVLLICMYCRLYKVQEAQLSPRDRAMRRVNEILPTAMQQCKSMVCNSAETTYTTSPDQIDGMKLCISTRLAVAKFSKSTM